MDKYYGIIALIIYVLALIAYIRYDATHNDEQEEEVEQVVSKPNVTSPLNLNDKNATVACLIAAIECRNEYKKNVQIVSVRKVG